MLRNWKDRDFGNMRLLLQKKTSPTWTKAKRQAMTVGSRALRETKATSGKCDSLSDQKKGYSLDSADRDKEAAPLPETLGHEKWGEGTIPNAGKNRLTRACLRGVARWREASIIRSTTATLNQGGKNTTNSALKNWDGKKNLEGM